MKETVVDFGKKRSPLRPVSTGDVDVEVVQTYKFLGVHLNNKPDWSTNTEALYKNSQSCLFFLSAEAEVI